MSQYHFFEQQKITPSEFERKVNELDFTNGVEGYLLWAPITDEKAAKGMVTTVDKAN